MSENKNGYKRIENLEKKIAKLEKQVRATKESNRARDERVAIAIDKLKKALPHVNFED